MKLLKYYTFLIILAIATSCTDDMEDKVTEGAQVGGLIKVESVLTNYVVGEPTKMYPITIVVVQTPSVYTESIEVYKRYYKKVTLTGSEGQDSVVTRKSAQVLVETIQVTDKLTHRESIDVNFNTLREGIEIDGEIISTDDTELVIGDYWELEYRSKLNTGQTFINYSTSKIAISTRYAGIYIVTDSHYIHPSLGNQGDWNGEEVIIESVDAITYRILANGPFTTDDNPDNFFYFSVATSPSADGTYAISIPKVYNGDAQTLWGADELATCEANPVELKDANCGDSDYVINNDATGEDIVKLSHGYIRSSGTRQFYYTLKKKI